MTEPTTSRTDRLYRVERVAAELANAAAVMREQRADGDGPITNGEMTHLVELAFRVIAATQEVKYWG